MLKILDARARRLASAILANLIGRFATLLAPFAVMPAMLHHFGDAEFGVWATAVSLTSVAVVADLGIGNGMLTRVSAASGRSDNAAIRRYASSAFAVVTTVALGLLVLVLSGFAVFRGPPVALVVFCAFFVGMPGSTFYQMLFGLQKVPLANALQTVGAALAVCGALGAIVFQAPPWAVALAYSLPPIAITYLGAAGYFLRLPEHRPAFRLIESSSATDLVGLGSRFFVLSILTAVTLNIDNAVITSIAGPDAVTAYTIPMRLGSLLSLVIMALYMPMWGANGEALARGEYGWVRRSAIRMSLAGAGVVFLGGVGLWAVGGWLIQLWVGRAFENQELVLASFVLLSTVTALTSPFNMVLNAMGRVTVQIYPWLAVLFLTLALKVLVAPIATWPFAAITGLSYAAVISPLIIVTALKALKAAPTAGVQSLPKRSHTTKARH